MQSAAAHSAALIIFVLAGALVASGPAPAAEQQQVPANATPQPSKDDMPISGIVPYVRKTPAPAIDAAAEPPAAAAGPEAKPAQKTETKSEPAKADDGEKAVAKTVAPAPKPQQSIVISVNLSKQSMAVSEDGKAKFNWPVSSGRVGYLTPTGTFRPQWMAKMWHSRKYDDAPMPNSIFFTGGFAIHATAAYSQIGRAASHGCVRLAPTNAATLFKMVQKHGMDRTKIVVYGSTPIEPTIARNDPRLAPRPLQVSPVRYTVAAPSKSALDVLFGGEQRRIVYATPPKWVRAPSRPVYVTTQNGTVIRVR